MDKSLVNMTSPVVKLMLPIYLTVPGLEFFRPLFSGPVNTFNKHICLNCALAHFFQS